MKRTLAGRSPGVNAVFKVIFFRRFESSFFLSGFVDPNGSSSSFFRLRRKMPVAEATCDRTPVIQAVAIVFFRYFTGGDDGHERGSKVLWLWGLVQAGFTE